MARVVMKFNKTHVMADGKVLSDEQFMAKPYVVDYDKNKKWYTDIAVVYDPLYSKKEMVKIEVARAAKRKEELEAEMVRIRKELAEL